MRKVFLAFFGAALIAGAPVAIAGGEGCNIQGTWLGFDENGVAAWMSSYYGQTASHGTNSIESPGFDLTLGGVFPNASKGNTLRGAWERVDGNTFNFTMLGIVADDGGATQWILKLSGRLTLMNGCSTEYIESTVEVFLPGMDPLQDDPYVALELDGHYGYRVSVDPPAL